MEIINSLKLRAMIVERGFVQEQIADQLGITVATLNYKINNKREFKAREIKKMADILHFTSDDINEIFFAE